jgi:hypothetical protein
MVARANFVPDTTPLNVWMYPVPDLVTFAIGGSVTWLKNPFRKNALRKACWMLGVGAPAPTSIVVLSVTVADADFDPSAADVAVTVTFELAVISPGAV